MHKEYLFGVCLLEVIILLLLLKSEFYAVLFLICVGGPIFLFFFPEFGLAVAMTNSILLLIIFDYIEINLPMPVLMVYLLLLAGGILLYEFQKPLDKTLPVGRLNTIAVCIGLLMILGLQFSTNPAYGLYKVTFYLLSNMLLIFIPLIYRHDLYKIQNVLFFTFLGGIVLTIYCTIKAHQIPIHLRFRVSESVNEIWLARSLGVSALAGLFLFVKSRRKMIKILILATMPFFLYSMIRTGSRAPFIGLILATFVYYFLQPGQPLRKKLIVFSIAAFFAGLLAYFFISGTTVAARISDPTVKDVVSTVSRFASWVKAIEHFLASPLTGIGTGSFKLEFMLQSIQYPHNLLLEMACENGIFGLTLIVIFIFLAIKYGRMNIKHYYKSNSRLYTQLSIAVMTIFIFALWNAMFSGDIRSNEIVWLCTGFIYVLYLSREKYSNQNV